MNRTFAVSLSAAAALLSACAPLALDRDRSETSAFAERHAGGPVKWLGTDEERRRARSEVDRLLEQPISADDAARIALAYSPALQALLFEGVAGSARATQSARLPNPVFTFERLVRREEGGSETEIGRMLAFSVLELLTLPARMEAADHRQQQLRVKAAGDVLQAAAMARQAWVRAVAARQALTYYEQVKEAADAGAELARRMQTAGNFSRLQRAREHAFYAEATAQLARASHDAAAAREGLSRALGLDATQAAALNLPERLPDLPPAPDDESLLTRVAMEQRLDVRMAQAELAYFARQQGLTRVASYVDGLHIAAVRNSETGRAPQKGFEVELALPVFDFGDARRAASASEYMAAMNRVANIGVHAASQVRESYGAYRTTYDLARHYRDEIVPLRKMIADEMLLKYNGMLIGVFELLADSRGQIATVIQSIDAQRDFWLADAGLRTTLLGQPVSGAAMQTRPASGERNERH